MPVNRATLFLTSVITLLPWCIQTCSGKTLLSKYCTACATKRFPHPNTSQISFLKAPFTHLSIPFPTLLLESPHLFSCPTLLFTYLNLQPTQADVSQSCLTSQYFSTPVPHQSVVSTLHRQERNPHFGPTLLLLAISFLSLADYAAFLWPQQLVKLSSSPALLPAPTWKRFHFPIWVAPLENPQAHLTASKGMKIKING